MKGLTIGEILDAIVTCDHSDEVVFDFCGVAPKDLISWRGNYSEPAIDWSDKHMTTVDDFRTQLKRDNGRKVFIGYNGGKYLFGPSQVLHVDHPGAVTHTVILFVERSAGRVILHTGQSKP